MTPSRDPRLSLARGRRLKIYPSQLEELTSMIADANRERLSRRFIFRHSTLSSGRFNSRRELIISDNLANCINHLFFLHHVSEMHIIRSNMYVPHARSLSRGDSNNDS